MVRQLAISALAASFLALAPLPTPAHAGKAPCGSFQKLPDGKWKVLRTVKIQNGQVAVVLNPGTPISPGAHVTGVDIYAALQANCQSTGSTAPAGSTPPTGTH